MCVLDVQSTTALTRLTVPKLVLEEGTDYFWRAQFTDSTGKVSEWSAYGYFTTETTDADLNANGIPDVQEVASTVDLDRDGVKDDQAAPIHQVGQDGRYQRPDRREHQGLPHMHRRGVSRIGRYPSAGLVCLRQTSRMPFALINFKIAVVKPGDQAVVKLYFSKAASSLEQMVQVRPDCRSVVRLFGLCQICQ